MNFFLYHCLYTAPDEQVVKQKVIVVFLHNETIKKLKRMKRKATAKWNGNGLEGKGALTSTSGVLSNTPYGFAARFKDEEGKSGTNPEELIAAAHAGCFTMALSFQIAGAGFTADELVTDAVVSLDQGEGGFSITGITLKLTGKVSGMSEEKFVELANAAKAGCPISRALSAVPITLEAKFIK